EPAVRRHAVELQRARDVAADEHGSVGGHVERQRGAELQQCAQGHGTKRSPAGVSTSSCVQPRGVCETRYSIARAQSSCVAVASGGRPLIRSATLGLSITASTTRSATWTPLLRSSSAADCVSARVAIAEAAHVLRPAIPRLAEPPVTWTNVPLPCAARWRHPSRSTLKIAGTSPWK